jgi:molybdopterin converting factor small subunit
MIVVELFGVPRLRAGTGRIEVDAATCGDALDRLATLCPALDGTVIVNRRVGSAYRLCLNGESFPDDPETPLSPGDALLLLAADAGG